MTGSNEINKKRRQLIGMAATACALSPGLVLAAKRSTGPLVIGQTAAFSGGPAGTVHELTVGAFMHLEHLNRQGGIRGRQIKLTQLDDGFQPDRAARNAATLISEGAVALFLTRGTPTNELILKNVKPKVPLIAPSTGAMSLRDPVIPNVFNVRSSYRLEGKRVVLDLAAIGLTRIGVITVGDSFGSDVMAGVLPTFREVGLTPLFVEKFDRNTKVFDAHCQAAAKAGPQAVVVVGATEPSVKLIRGLRAAGCNAMIGTLSTNASAEFIAQLGPVARGVGVTQVTPKTRQVGIPLVAGATQRLAEYNANAKSKFAALTPAMLEGYASALVLAEGLRRAEADAPEALIEAFDSIRDFSLGWKSITYTPTNHAGLDFAELSVIDADGRFVY